MEPLRPNVRPAVLLSLAGILVVVYRLQMWWLETTVAWSGLPPRTNGEWALLVATFLLVVALSLFAAVIAERRINRVYAVLLPAAVGGLVTAHYISLPGVALGAGIGLLVASKIARRVAAALLEAFAAIVFGTVGGAAILIFTGNPGDGWHGPMAWSMLAFACVAGGLLLAWRACRGGARHVWVRVAGHCALLAALLAGQWLSLSVDTLWRVWWLGTNHWKPDDRFGYKKTHLCIIPFDVSWCYRGLIGVTSFAGGQRVNDFELATIGGWQELWNLQLNEAPVTDQGMNQVRRLSRLTSLGLRAAPITDDSVKVMTTLLGLKSLDLRGTQVSDGVFSALRGYPLWELHLDGTRITDTGLQGAQGLIQLRYLTLSGTRVRGPGLRHLRALPQLFYLGLADTAITDDHLAAQAWSETPPNPPGTRFALDLSGTRITDGGIQYLAGVPFSLLRLARTNVTDEGLRSLARVGCLDALDLSETQVTDAGLVYLQPFTTLQVLQLDGTRVTAAGLTQLRELAGPLGRLRSVDARRTAVRGDDVGTLRRELPDLTVVTDDGATR